MAAALRVKKIMNAPITIMQMGKMAPAAPLTSIMFVMNKEWYIVTRMAKKEATNKGPANFLCSNNNMLASRAPHVESANALVAHVGTSVYMAR